MELRLRVTKVNNGYIVQDESSLMSGSMHLSKDLMVALDATSLAALIKKLATDSDKTEMTKK